MFEEVESNISKIISHCLHESISNKRKSPFYISPSQIVGFFPDQLSIDHIDITQQFSAGWQISNNIINCYFGLKVICNNNKTKEWIMNIMNNNNNQNNNNNRNECNSLFIQPINIENGFISKQIKSEWNKLNDQNYNGLICRFNAMNEYHEFGIIPFVKCTQFNHNMINNNNPKSDKKMFSENNENKKQYDEQYDDWYCQQYLDYYGYNDNHNDDDNDDNDGVLQPIHENQQYDGDRNDDDDNDENEDIDLDMNYNRNIMKGSMNRGRKRRFNQCDGDNMMNPYKRRKFNHCNSNQIDSVLIDT